MLTKLKLVNFQSHKSREIVLDKRITCIIGSSDVGKTAVLRALRWLCLNKGSPRVFQRKGSKFVKVCLTVDGKLVVRAKGKQNRYEIDNHKFAAIGTNVPERVSQLLNLTELNFQQQHDAPFWFSKSAGQVSKELNQVVNLELIDSSLGRIASRARDTKSRIAVIEERLALAKKSYKDLAWVEKARVEWGHIVALNALASDLQRAISKLGVLLAQIENVRILRANAQQIIDEGKQCLELETGYRELSELRQDLELLLHHIQKEENQVCQLQQTLNKLKKELRKQKVCPTCGQAIP